MKLTSEYIDKNRNNFVTELFDFLRIPSISADSAYKEDMVKCAEYVKNALLSAGASRAEVYPTKGNPVVYGEKIIDKSLPTVLIYAHYDVMPVEPLGLWISPPFSPEIRDGKIWGRGADDDKGQGFIHIKAFEAMYKTGELPCNVKFMIEGEEEIGSGSLGQWCAEYKDMLAADIILISDTSMISMETPSITCGLRGISYMEVEVTGPSHDLHSGIYGGAVANPLNVLSKMIASLTDDNGRVTIDGFYDDVKEFTAEERAAITSAPFSIEEYKEALQIGEVQGEKGYATQERTGIRPSLDVNGIWGGHITEGTKTVIPSKAYAKISMRLVADQSPDKIAELFETYFKKIAPPSVMVSVEYIHGGNAYNCPTTTPAYQAAERAITTTFGKKPIPFYSGGSIPIVSTFEKTLGIKSILLGFGLHSDATHSPNESFPVENFIKGIFTVTQFYKEFTKNV